jgi:hypothetical protein
VLRRREGSVEDVEKEVMVNLPRSKNTGGYILVQGALELHVFGYFSSTRNTIISNYKPYRI